MLGLRSHTELRMPLECYVISDNVLVHSAVESHRYVAADYARLCDYVMCGQYRYVAAEYARLCD